MHEFLSPLLIILALAAQYFLSSRNSIYLGFIVPILVVGVLTWMLFTNLIGSMLSYTLIVLLLLVFLLEQWFNGRKALHETTQKERDQFKSTL